MTAPKQDSVTDTHQTYDKVRASASHAYHDARDRASDTARKTAAAIEANPLAVLVGGAAIGALAGALIPRSAKEKQLLAPIGARLSDAARQAVTAARDAGKEELANAGLTPGAARERGKSLLDGVVKAVTTAGSAAAEKAKTSVKSPAAEV